MPKFETLILTEKNILYKKSSTISHYCDVVTTLFFKRRKVMWIEKTY